MAESYSAILPFLLGSFFLIFVSGSTITLESSPSSVVATLTNSLTIRCSVNGSDLAQAIVGRRDVSGDMQFVMSLVVTRGDGEHVASITRINPAKALTDLSTLQVTGDLSGANGELAYLELKWDQPTEQQAGKYFCEANGMDMAGHSTVFSQSAMVNFTEPTLGELVTYIRDLSVEMKQKDDYILTLVNQVQHIENGTVMCGDSSRWNERLGSYKHRDVTIPFDMSYASTPVVHLDVVNFRNQHTSSVTYATDFRVYLTDVNERNFTMRCIASAVTPRIYALDANWISFPQ